MVSLFQFQVYLAVSSTSKPEAHATCKTFCSFSKTRSSSRVTGSQTAWIYMTSQFSLGNTPILKRCWQSKSINIKYKHTSLHSTLCICLMKPWWWLLNMCFGPNETLLLINLRISSKHSNSFYHKYDPHFTVYRNACPSKVISQSAPLFLIQRLKPLNRLSLRRLDWSHRRCQSVKVCDGWYRWERPDRNFMAMHLIFGLECCRDKSNPSNTYSRDISILTKVVEQPTLFAVL